MSKRDEPRRRCPLCGKAVSADHDPFCSAACRDRDLIAWLDERYVVEAPPPDDMEDS